MSCNADFPTFAACKKWIYFPSLLSSTPTITENQCAGVCSELGLGRLSFWLGLPFYSDEKQTRRRRERQIWEKGRESVGCVRSELRTCDTSYLGNGPSLSWGVALSAALVATTPPKHIHIRTNIHTIITSMTKTSFMATLFKMSALWELLHINNLNLHPAAYNT